MIRNRRIGRYAGVHIFPYALQKTQDDINNPHHATQTFYFTIVLVQIPHNDQMVE